MSIPSALPRPTRRPMPARWVHPLAWWAWALGLAAAALRTTNPLLLAGIGGVAAVVVAARRSDAPWARAFAGFVRLGLLVIAIRVLFQVLFGAPVAGTVVLTLPQVTLPEWAAGVRIGGEVTAEALVAAAYQGLRLAVVLCCVGAATSLASPSRLLKALPNVLYEAGVAVTVALSFAPQTVMAVGRIREARRLRGMERGGLRHWPRMVLPVLEGALERSVALAASMDSRGFGRRVSLPPKVRRLTTAGTVVGMLCLAVGVYALLDGSGPAHLGWPVLAFGAAALVAALVASGSTGARTRYRPDPWRTPEWVAASSGLLVFTGVVLAERLGVPLHPSVDPLVLPGLPVAPTLALLVGLLPALLTPPPPSIEPHGMSGLAAVVDAEGFASRVPESSR